MGRWLSVLALQVAAALVLCVPADAQKARPRTPSPPGAAVFFIDPPQGATVPGTFKVRFGVTGMEIAPAGQARPNSGHHHIIVDTDLPPFDERIPADFNHLHFGSGQTEAELTLPPGDHTLQLLFADHDHVPHDPPIVSQELRIRVVEAVQPTVEAAPTGKATPASSGRTAAPEGARVYFIYPQDGSVIYPRSTIRFGLRGMGVAPAGVDKPNTGHHHLLVDVETPPLDRPLPNDFNHIHMGKGQTEHKLTLTPGEHTLQLILADHNHVPHDPPIMTERIRITVGRPRAARR
ncbi:DUF4399 domain-containing protein [Prosthecomicrobium sp. N25]|uniref:DUF4399 domain-containing protein n=1 Tax=Prosthecomicrobium sp. N25 TaxID=3129254 RepID=UPI003076A5A6